MTEPIRRPPPARRPRRLAKLLLASCTLLFCAVVGEGVLRITGGYRLFAPRLEPVRSASDPETVLAMAHDVVEPFTAHWRAARPDLDIAWLETSPPPPPAPPRLELPLLPQRDWLLNYYVVNEVLLRSPLAKKLMQAPNLTLPDEFTVFEPPGRKTAPHYRYPASRTLPTGLMTNQFGFRGREIDCDKPDRTVRIAFVGASTTVEAHQLPHTVADLVEHWLGRWAQARGLDVRFETINAAREAIKSPDIRAIVTDEVMPLAIDYLVYYEGANQFQPDGLAQHVAIEGDYVLASPPPGVVGNYDEVQNADSSWLDGIATWSAAARYLRGALAGSKRLAEPEKPAQHLTLSPEILDPNTAFPLERAADVLECGVIAADLDAIRKVVEGGGARLVVSTFWWFAQDGMLLDPVWAANVHVHLNRAYWPFRYSTIRALADLQNRFFVAWAAARGVDLIDVGGELPQHEQLAIDAIHHNQIGVRLKAWIMFAALTRFLERDLEAGRLPVPDPEPTPHHPNIGPTKQVPRAQILGH
ncbi:MAG: hypothetical protein KDE27_14980 [Planctomycetes bacterium]|nr:hypothetical protein [Planctomycetota bacterium]